eukprot:15434881-Alexandrium_andersonii.AAC.1
MWYCARKLYSECAAVGCIGSRAVGGGDCRTCCRKRTNRDAIGVQEEPRRGRRRMRRRRRRRRDGGAGQRRRKRRRRG